MRKAFNCSFFFPLWTTYLLFLQNHAVKLETRAFGPQEEGGRMNCSPMTQHQPRWLCRAEARPCAVLHSSIETHFSWFYPCVLSLSCLNTHYRHFNRTWKIFCRHETQLYVLFIDQVTCITNYKQSQALRNGDEFYFISSQCVCGTLGYFTDIKVRLITRRTLTRG